MATGSYPGMHPVPQPYPGLPQATPPAKPTTPIPRRDILAGIALVIAAGLAVGGSFPNLDHAVDKQVNDNGTLGAVDSVINTSPWYYHTDLPRDPKFSYHLTQFFGIGLAVGAALAVAAAVLLLIGFSRRTTQVRTWGAVAGALLFGALLTTEMSVVNDLQWDAPAPAGAHVTTFGLGFWLLAAAGVVTVVAVVLLLIKERRVEPPTPRFGIPIIGQQPPINPQSQNPGQQHA